MANLNLLISGVVAISVFFIFVAFVFLPVGLETFMGQLETGVNPNISALQLTLLGVFGILGIVALMLLMLEGLGIVKLGKK